MRPSCEEMINEILPGFRAVLAKKLMDDHGLSQTRVAVLLDTTQPAISQYRRNLRGRNAKRFLESPGLLSILDEIADGIVKGRVKPEDTGDEFCKVCKFLRKNEPGP